MYSPADWQPTSDKTNLHTSADTSAVNGTPALTVIANIDTAQSTADAADAKATAAQTKANSLQTLIRDSADGTLVAKVGQTYGSLVNANGSFDAVKLTWSDSAPTVVGTPMRNDADGTDLCTIASDGTATPSAHFGKYATLGNRKVYDDISNNADGSVALGIDVEASCQYSFAQGYAARARGLYSSAFGASTCAQGEESSAFGYGTTAESPASMVSGIGTRSRGVLGAHVSGMYNSVGSYLEAVGNGTGESARSNARTLDFDGNEYLAGALSVGNAQTTVANLKTALLDLIHPVGDVVINVTGVNPGTTFGGTWSAFSTGRVIVGMGSNGTNTYDSAMATGGADTRNTGNWSGSTGSTAISVAQMPAHSHSISEGNSSSGSTWALVSAQQGGKNTTMTTNDSGSGQGHTHTIESHAHSVDTRQAYQTAYFWRRTA